MENMKLSVIIVSYKSWGVLENCLNSFNLYQPKDTYEIIVVNNFPQDQEVDRFSKRHSKVKFINNSGNYGFSHACNLGAKNSIGKYLLFLNPDTELTSDNAIDSMIATLSKNHSIGIVSCRTINNIGKIERELLFSNPWLLVASLRQIYKLIFGNVIRRRFKNSDNVWYPDWVSGSVLMIPKTLFDEIEGWNQTRFWMYHEDPDICNRVRNTGKEVALIRNKTIKHIGGGTSRTDIKTTVAAKTEVIISSHNYIQINTNKVEGIVLHMLFLSLNIFNLMIKSIFSLILLKPSKLLIYFGVILNSIMYYLTSIYRLTWKSPRIKT